MARSKTKSQKIHDYLIKDPSASVQAIAEAMHVTPGLVYNIRSKLKSSAGGTRGVKKARRKTRQKLRRGVAVSVTPNGTLEHLVAAARLIKACGGMEQARRALKVAEQVAGALQ